MTHDDGTTTLFAGLSKITRLLEEAYGEGK